MRLRIDLTYSIKVWNLAQPSIQHAIERSHQHRSPAVDTSVEPELAFKPVVQQAPVFSTNQVHTDYVDSVRWFGDCLLTKSTKNRVAYWSPDANRYKGAPLVLREFEMRGCEIWFVRMDICVPLDLLAVGNKFGKVYLFSLSGQPHSAAVQSSSSLAGGGSKRRKGRSQSFTGGDEHSANDAPDDLQESAAIASEVESQVNPSQTQHQYSQRNVEFLPERFESAHPQKPLVVLGHPRCTSAVRQVSFSASLRHLVYGCDDGSIWCWNISVGCDPPTQL